MGIEVGCCGDIDVLLDPHGLSVLESGEELHIKELLVSHVVQDGIDLLGIGQFIPDLVRIYIGKLCIDLGE